MNNILGALPVVVAIGMAVYFVIRLFRWSENNHAEIREYTAEVVDKQTQTRGGKFHPYRVGYNGEIVYYLTLKTDDGKKNRYTVSIVDFDKAIIGEKGILKLQGTRFVSFERG